MEADVLTKELEELARFMSLLVGDVGSCVIRGKLNVQDREEPDQFWARMLVRSFFAAVEGLSHGARKVAVAAHELSVIRLTPAEEALLTAPEVYLTEKGKPKSRERRFRTFPSLLFGLELLTRLSGLARVAERGNTGSRAVVEGLKVRDRITHPKSIEGIRITWGEVELVREAAHWLGLELRRITSDLEKRYFA